MTFSEGANFPPCRYVEGGRNLSRVGRVVFFRSSQVFRAITPRFPGYRSER
jgi:hypothetical protein